MARSQNNLDLDFGFQPSGGAPFEAAGIEFIDDGAKPDKKASA